MYLSDGITKPNWDYDQHILTVDRTYALDALASTVAIPEVTILG